MRNKGSVEKPGCLVQVHGRGPHLPMCNNTIGADVDICRPPSGGFSTNPKYWIVILSLIIMALSADASSKFEKGIRLGLNISSVTDETNVPGLFGKEMDTDDIQTGFAGGVFSGYKFSRVFSVRMELLYTKKGGRVSWMYDLGDRQYFDLKTSYVEVPLLLKICLYPNRRVFKQSLFLGYSISSNRKTEILNLPDEMEDRITAEDFDNSDRSFVIGGETAWKAGPGDIILDIRFMMGLSDISDPQLNLPIYNSTISITAGYSW